MTTYLNILQTYFITDLQNININKRTIQYLAYFQILSKTATYLSKCYANVQPDISFKGAMTSWCTYSKICEGKLWYFWVFLEKDIFYYWHCASQLSSLVLIFSRFPDTYDNISDINTLLNKYRVPISTPWLCISIYHNNVYVG